MNGADNHGAYQIEPKGEMSFYEAIRNRPSMYFGDIGCEGMAKGVFYALDEVMKEVEKKRCNQIDLVVHKDFSLEISHNGGSLPAGFAAYGQEEQKDYFSLPAMFNENGQAVDGFDDNRASYFWSRWSFHSINAASDWLELDIWQDGTRYHLRYENYTMQGIETEECPAHWRGMDMRWKYSEEVFHKTYHNEWQLGRRMRELAALNAGLTTTFTNTQNDGGAHSVNRNPLGLWEYLDYVGEQFWFSEPEHDPYFARAEGVNVTVSMAMRIERSGKGGVQSFANQYPTKEGGTHEDAMKEGIARAVDDLRYRRQYGECVRVIPGERVYPLEWQDVSKGIAAVVHVQLPEPNYSSSRGSVEDCTIYPLVKGLAYEMCVNLLGRYKDIREAYFDRIGV